MVEIKDVNGKTLLCAEDGETVELVQNGEVVWRGTAEGIDATHFSLGDVAYHTYEFAELLDRRGVSVRIAEPDEMEGHVEIQDMHYMRLLLVPEGEEIEVVNPSGEVAFTGKVRAIDSTHFYVGSIIYHVHQFAMMLNETGATVRIKEAGR
jgi:hypothetical protein